LQDQQNQLVLSLSALTNVSVTQTRSGETLTTGNGTALVVGSQSFALQTTTSSDDMVQVLDTNGTNVTSSISGGDLGGTIQMRDQTIPTLLNQLDTLSNQFGSAFNAVQESGTDENGNAGSQFFDVPTAIAGSAAAISVAISNPSQIAASQDGSAEDNGNVANLIALQTTALPSGETPISAYANLVYQVGSLATNATAESGATTTSLLQLNDQLSSVSGVSIDQESTNLITYQTAYEAAARVVTTVQALFQITLAMGTAAAE
jgi:flagellar hook-associated protein 1 FlgK